MAFNIFFLLYFGLRFIAANDKPSLKFQVVQGWLKIYTSKSKDKDFLGVIMVIFVLDWNFNIILSIKKSTWGVYKVSILVVYKVKIVGVYK